MKKMSLQLINRNIIDKVLRIASFLKTGEGYGAITSIMALLILTSATVMAQRDRTKLRPEPVLSFGRKHTCGIQPPVDRIWAIIPNNRSTDKCEILRFNAQFKDLQCEISGSLFDECIDSFVEILEKGDTIRFSNIKVQCPWYDHPRISKNELMIVWPGIFVGSEDGTLRELRMDK